MTAPALVPATRPTLYFIGVTTGQSSILKVFPRWSEALGLRVVSFIKDDPLSRGALVTTHKIDCFRATRDLFEEIEPLSALMGEMSCIAKHDGRLAASAKDPLTSGLAIAAIVPAGHFARTGAEALLIGAGGASIAITWNLMQAERGADRPSRIIVSDIDEGRLDEIRHIHERFGADVPVSYVLAKRREDNDALVSALPAGSFVVNATGLGKDGPGSPITDAAVFPEGGYVWELNYRGDLVFLRQARAQAASRKLTVEDGWVYFLHGWTRVIADVFAVDIPTSGPGFERLSDLAGGRPNLGNPA
ncbi:MAG: shikimate dehydrogenase [Rhizobiales bacterium]|nr:shikimate dehydrogenase [Hyphomicrobiales bacterium]